MTNREWLNTLTDEQFRDWLINDYERIKFAYSNTYAGIVNWLKAEHIAKNSCGSGEFTRNGNGEWYEVGNDK